MLKKLDHIKTAEHILHADAPLVEFPYTKLLSSCINGMLHFFAEPQEVKDAWTLDYDKTGRPDDGYRRSRRKPGTTADSKELMHIRVRDMQIWKERDVPKFDDYLFWIAKTLDLLSFGLEHIVFPVARALDEHRKKSGIPSTIEQILRQGASLHVIRYVFYDPPSPETTLLATDHYDRSVLSVQLAANQPGLRMRTPKNTYKSLSLKDGNARVFPGQKMQLLTGGQITRTKKTYCVEGGAIPAIIHGVKHSPAERADIQKRWAIVLFSHCVLPLPDNLAQYIPPFP